MGRDPNTPDWVQHIAFQVKDVATLRATKQRLEAKGVRVVGPTNHELFQSINIFDPNGHRVELAAGTGTPQMLERLKSVAPQMLQEWSRTRRTVRDDAGCIGRSFPLRYRPSDAAESAPIRRRRSPD
jgi:glyoxylase I family protein